MVRISKIPVREGSVPSCPFFLTWKNGNTVSHRNFYLVFFSSVDIIPSIPYEPLYLKPYTNTESKDVYFVYFNDCFLLHILLLKHLNPTIKQSFENKHMRNREMSSG